MNGDNGYGDPGPTEEYAPSVREDEDESDGERLPEPMSGLAFREREWPPPVWMVPLLLLEGAITFFFGPSYSGKTLLAIHAIVQAVKAGKRVLFVEEEGTPWALKHQLREAGLRTDVEWSRVDFFFGAGPDLADEKWRRHLETKLLNFDLLVLDSWADVHSVDLLDHRKMNELLKWLRQTIRLLRKTCLTNAHTPKAVEYSDGEPKLSDLFGAQGQGAKVDGAFVVRDFREKKARKGEEEEEEPSGNPLKEVWNVKLRGQNKLPPRVGRVVKALLPDGKDVGVWRWENASPAQVRSRESDKKAADTIYEALAEWGPFPDKTSLYRRMGPVDGKDGPFKRPGKEAFYRAFDMLLAEGRAVRDEKTEQVSAS